jgi:hypothetical protein
MEGVNDAADRDGRRKKGGIDKEGRRDKTKGIRREKNK